MTQQRRRPGPRQTFGQRLTDVLLVAVAFALGAAVLTAGTTLRIWQVGQQDGRRHVDAIVVLGAAQYNGRPSDALAARLDHAIDLYIQGYAPYLITTGGNLPGDWTTEAEVGRKYAIKRGVPESALLMENSGHSTLDSIQHVRAIFDAKSLHTALFVSDRSHMLRVLRLAQDEGIEAWASPTTTSPDDIDSDLIYNSMFHEVGAMGYYMLVAGDPEGVIAAPAGSAAPDGSGQSAAPAGSPAP
jgi:vancomycin permeability regulator SanA